MQRLIRLFRLRLALLNGIAAGGGYLLLPGTPVQAALWGALFGVTLLAAGGSAINQVLERDLDRQMERTRLRPLPQGEMTPFTATALGGSCILAGLLILGAAGGYLPVLLGFTALLWYLAVYTPLKHRSPFALPIGALCGALSPLIGWGVAGGNLADYRIVLLAGLLYLWQIPHFWLVQQRHANDFRRAGIPLFAAGFIAGGSDNLFRLWLVAVTAAAMLLPALGIIEHYVALWYAAFPVLFVIFSRLRSDRAFYVYVNLLPLLVTLALVIQH